MRKILLILNGLIFLVLFGCVGEPPLVSYDGSVSSKARDALVEPAMSDSEASTLNERDLMAAYKAFIAVLEQSEPFSTVPWQDEITGNSGVIVPGPRYFVNDNYCLYYTHRYFLDSVAFALSGSACKGEDGEWRSLN